jgi:hypothetical protein
LPHSESFAEAAVGTDLPNEPDQGGSPTTNEKGCSNVEQPRKVANDSANKAGAA